MKKINIAMMIATKLVRKKKMNIRSELASWWLSELESLGVDTLE
jgi:hypothetical protein